MTQAEEFKSKKIETYKVEVICTNCGDGLQDLLIIDDIPKGTLVDDWIETIYCGKCNCLGTIMRK